MQQPAPTPGLGPGAYQTPMTRVELSVSATNLPVEDVMSLSDPLCILYMKESVQQSYLEVGRTEMVKDESSPHWVKKFELDYRFEERQLLKFHVFDWDTKSNNPNEQDSLGTAECSLGEIMACQGSQLKKALSKGGGTLVMSGEEVSTSKEEVTLNMSGKDLDKKDFFGKSDPFLVFYRTLQNNALSAVHKTEIIKNNLNPVWKPIKVPVSRLCGGDDERSIKIECYDWDEGGGHDFIGECHTNLATLREGSGARNTYTLINPKKQKKKKNYKGSGTLILHNISSRIVPTFLDYIRGGLQLHFTVAVDFTASNGDPRQPNSLHFRQEGVDNQYTLAIKAVGEIIQDYDSDKLFPSLGFGARLPPQWDVSHEFYLNGSAESPYCQGVEGILAAYHHSLQTVGLYGPTNFSPVIRHVSQFAKAHQDGLNYFVLLIITDGIISDMNDTKRALVEASNLPMSVIIVGVGQEDFSAMEELDGDEQRLSSNGVFASRDIVQFVELRRHLSAAGGRSVALSKAQLAKDVLAEVPLQVVSWMTAQGFLPHAPTQPLPPTSHSVQ